MLMVVPNCCIDIPSLGADLHAWESLLAERQQFVHVVRHSG